MDKCSLCEKDLPNERIHLGYTECLDCSEVDKYSSHTVYPEHAQAREPGEVPNLQENRALREELPGATAVSAAGAAWRSPSTVCRWWRIRWRTRKNGGRSDPGLGTAHWRRTNWRSGLLSDLGQGKGRPAEAGEARRR